MATLGRPAVNAPRSLDLRSVQSTIDSIRQRLKADEAELLRLGNVADTSSVTGQVQSLIAAVRSLGTRVSALEAALGVDDVITLAAGQEVVANYPIVMVGPSSCGPADPSDPTQIHALVGMSRNAGGVGSPIEVQRRGSMSIANSTFEVGRAVYAGIDGLTQNPTYGDFVIPVGVATAAGAIWISPGGAALQQPGLYGSEFDDFLPVTWGLIRERMRVLDELLDQPDGFVVKAVDALVTRALIAGSGSGITIENADGVDGDPIFTAEP